mmetsp:Transcript_2945/g.9671  ORF Transcript_2945/g.9671 Transcript_2945/m.9671 type:complete len:645 (-) Transcript_2945:901-2835(-)
MADPVIFIVGKLNEYFKSNLTLVDFDEKSQVELIQILNDVLAELDGSIKADVRDEPREARVAKIVQLLVVLKYPPLKSAHDDDREAVERGLAVGEKSAIYPILHWLLDRLPQHKKRAYVARFLYPVDVPQEFMQDEVLAECYNHYKHLQGEFKRAHQAVEKTRQTPIHPVEMKQEIATLEEEKKQLHQKIDKLKRQNDDVHDFHKLLAATNNLRLQQDEDARLGDNMRKQKVALQGAEQRKKDALKRLNGLRNSTSASADAHMLLEQLQSEVQQLTQRVQHELPRELEQKREKLARMTEARFEPQRTADDVDEMNRNIMDDQSRIASLRKRIDQTVADRNDTKLANFKQHATMISRKLSDKENELEKLEGEHAKVTKEIEQQETLMTELGGAKFMTRDEFKKFGNQLREKTHVYKKLKAELGELRAESVTLHRTEQIAMKEKTLEEISNMVRSITQQLKEKKNDLAPQIKKLREVRNSYQIVETDFLQKKATYDKVAVGLDVERQQLEHECDAYQEEALQKESRFHYLNCLTSMAEATLKRIDDEEGWKAGKGRGLLPNFKCYEDLYTNKLAQQQAFSDQLRKQRATIEKHEGPNMKQRAVYADLEKLLAFKLKIVEDDTAGQMGFASTEYDLGNARVAQFSTL